MAPETVQAMAERIMAVTGGETGHYAMLGELRQPTLIVSGDDELRLRGAG